MTDLLMWRTLNSVADFFFIWLTDADVGFDWIQRKEKKIISLKILSSIKRQLITIHCIMKWDVLPFNLINL